MGSLIAFPVSEDGSYCALKKYLEPLSVGDCKFDTVSSVVADPTTFVPSVNATSFFYH